MATSYFIPTRESELVTWGKNFDSKITEDPTRYGLTAIQATAFNTLFTTFHTAYQTANEPDTRSPSHIIAKDTAKDALIEGIRELARIVQAAPDVTDEQKTELGLTVRDTEPTPIPVPSEAPGLDVLSTAGRTVRIRLHDAENPARRARPSGVQGATIFSYVGDAPPATIAEWKFESNTTRTVVDVAFAPEVANGATVWFTAFWYNPRANSGPAALPVSANIPGGLAAAA